MGSTDFIIIPMLKLAIEGRHLTRYIDDYSTDEEGVEYFDDDTDKISIGDFIKLVNYQKDFPAQFGHDFLFQWLNFMNISYTIESEYVFDQQYEKMYKNFKVIRL